MTNTPIFFAVMLLGVTPLLLVLALAVRFAKNAPVLSNVNYDNVADIEALNKRTGNRLFVLPTASLLFGSLGLYDPLAAGMYVLCFLGVLFAFIAYVVVTAYYVS